MIFFGDGDLGITLYRGFRQSPIIAGETGIDAGADAQGILSPGFDQALFTLMIESQCTVVIFKSHDNPPRKVVCPCCSAVFRIADTII